METVLHEKVVTLEVDKPIWDHFFTVAPLVVIGTREGEGYDLAPKHMVTPMGWENYFGFVCTPRHATYHNAKHTGAFTVSFPRPSQVVLTSLTASLRCDKPGRKPVLRSLPVFRAAVVDGIFLEDSYLFLECELDRVVDGFGPNSMVIGRIVAAHVHKDALRMTEVADQEVVARSPLLTYVSPGRYGVVQETFAFPFPSHYKR